MKKNKALGLTLIGLVLLLVTSLMLKNTGRTDDLRSSLFTLDTLKLDKIVISKNQAGVNNELSLMKESGNWFVGNKDKKFETNPSVVSSFIRQLTTLKPKRLASRKKEKWEKYQVNDSLGKQIQLYESGTSIANLVVGKISFNQQSRSGTTYIRLESEEDVYSVDGMIGMELGRDINYWRNNILCKLNPADITELVYSYPADSGFTVKQFMGKWTVNSMPLDSHKVRNFINRFQNLTATNFADEEMIPGGESYKLIVKGNNFDPVEIQGIKSVGGNTFIFCQKNNQSRFSDSGVFNKVFVKPEIFFGSI